MVHGVSGGASTAPAEDYTAKATRRGIAFVPSDDLPVFAKTKKVRFPFPSERARGLGAVAKGE